MSDQPMRQLACAIRMGDLAAANNVLDGLYGYSAEQVSMGRADADRRMRRDPPLAQLSEDPLPHIDGWAYRPPSDVAPKRSRRRTAAC